jgi:cell wall assembly regulator SMI1
MDEIWKRIEAWLAANAPDIRADLQPGASDADLASAAAAFGVELPSDVVASYRVHDGTRGGAGPLLGDWRLLSLAAAAQEWKTLQEWADGGEFEDSEAEPAAQIKDDWWNPRWIPVASNSAGDFLCVDLDPAPAGTRGQVMSYYHAEPRRELVAASIERWLADFAAALVGAKYRVDDGWLTKVE